MAHRPQNSRKRKVAKMTHYKTAVKRKVATVLYTRVRTTVVFSKLTFKTELLVRDVCKISRLRNRNVILSLLLQCFLKALQNRSEKLKTTFSKACFRDHNFEFQQGFIVLFKWPHTESTIKLDTSRGWATQGPNESTKTVVLSIDHYKTAVKVTIAWASGLKPQKETTFF